MFYLSKVKSKKTQKEKIAEKTDLIRNHNLNTIISLIALLSVLYSIPTIGQDLKKTIKIGFLIRDKKDIAIQQKAKLVVDRANANGGYKGQIFELVIKSCDGPWGITSKQTVALIFEDQVPIVVTALDGRNAHLAEQVTAKSHVVMLSTLASDPSLSRAYVPWYFRMVPDDRQQAVALVKQIYQDNKTKKVAVVALDNYDGKKSAEAFIGEVKQKGYVHPEVFKDLNEDELIKMIKLKSWDAVVLAGTLKDVDKIENLVNNYETFAFLNFFSFFESSEQFDNVKSMFAPSMDYVQDGILIAIEAIKKFGPDAEAIRVGFKDLKFEGSTGKVEFDKFGNRLIE